MDWRLGVLVLALSVVVVVFVMTPPEDALPPMASAPGVIAPVDIPMAPMPAGEEGVVAVQYGDADGDDEVVLQACRPMAARLTAMADENFAAKVGEAVKKDREAEGVAAWCKEALALSDDDLKAKVTGELGVSP